MKTIGERALEFRLSKQWNTTRMANEVGTSRQSIENLEATGDRSPRYIATLARVMGLTVDDLMNGRPTGQSDATAPLDTTRSNQAPALAEHAHAAINNEASAKELLIQLGALLQKTDPITRAQTAPILAQLAKTPELAAELGTRLDDTITMGTKAPFVPFNPFPNK